MYIGFVKSGIKEGELRCIPT